MSPHQWQFAPRFRCSIFGWRSQPPIKGAVLFLEKISPALEQVDSSSGAIGAAVNNAIEVLVPIISKPNVPDNRRQKWLERLWEALQNDHMPYIEYLGDFWGELCVTPELASFWADEFIGVVKHIWSPETLGHNFFKGTTACLSALFSAKRYTELLDLLAQAKFKFWNYRRFGIKALFTMGKLNEALKYAEESGGLNVPKSKIASACEEILITMGLEEEAYDKYAIEANQKLTNVATFRAIVKKYLFKSPLDILKKLIEDHPGEERKWFAAAKDAGFFELAIELARKNPADPHTLIRASKEYAISKSDFAISSGIASLHWIIQGYGYEISSADIITVYSAIMAAAKSAEISDIEVKNKINKLLLDSHPNSQFVKSILAPYLSS